MESAKRRTLKGSYVLREPASPNLMTGLEARLKADGNRVRHVDERLEFEGDRFSMNVEFARPRIPWKDQGAIWLADDRQALAYELRLGHWWRQTLLGAAGPAILSLAIVGLFPARPERWVFAVFPFALYALGSLGLLATHWLYFRWYLADVLPFGREEWASSARRY